jgi:hypothetical protein
MAKITKKITASDLQTANARSRQRGKPYAISLLRASGLATGAH